MQELTELVAFVSSYSLLFIAGGAVVLVFLGAYIGSYFSAPKIEKTNYVTGELDALAERMKEAERIGHFGSFLWDFEDPTQSFWTPQLFALLEMDYNAPPTPEQFVALAEEKERDKVAGEWKKISVTSGPFSFTFAAVSKNGRHMHLRMQGKMTPKRDGLEPKRIEGVITDVTREMAIDKAKTEFVSLASHQLKTPLTSISWLAEALQRGTKGALQPAQVEYIANIQEAAARMIAMVNDLLNVSRIELDTLAIRPEVLDACKLMESVIKEQQHTADAKKIAFAFTCAQNLPQLTADPQLLRMIFQNLLSNAIKYTPENGKVTCDMQLAEAGRELVFLSVKDSGIGIPKAEQPRIFEKLHRASNAQTLVPDGTGLGLYLVKTILDKVGGGISFESVEGSGTTFFATIPFAWKPSGDKPLAGVKAAV